MIRDEYSLLEAAAIYIGVAAGLALIAWRKLRP